MNRLHRRRLQVHEILAWADAYHAASGKWPTRHSGKVVGALFETWHGIDAALRNGCRGFPGGSSLAQLLAKERGVRNIHDLPPLTEEMILRWADEHYQRTGSWPTTKSGRIPSSDRENWASIDGFLREGKRGLPGGTTLARLLAKHRGYRNRKQLPPLTEAQILAWADLHFQRTGAWPKMNSGSIVDAPDETWLAVNTALRNGQRGLPGGSSLVLLLAQQRGVPYRRRPPKLTIQEILAWADAYHEQTGEWPTTKSGPIPPAPGVTWAAIDQDLQQGFRGLPGGSSLAKLLAAERGVRNIADLPDLSERLMVGWAKAHFRRTGEWPIKTSGPIPEAPGETWGAVDTALAKGSRGLRGGSSLIRLLARHQLRPSRQGRAPLSKRKIVTWADAHFERTGQWPTTDSGPVLEAPGERWDLIDAALRLGLRGLSGGSSLARLLATKRGVRNRMCLPPLNEEQILHWARLHFRRTGSWPTCSMGAILDAPGEKWSAVEDALRQGHRGLPGGSSLAKLLARVKNGQAQLPGEEAALDVRPATASDSGAHLGEGTGLPS